MRHELYRRGILTPCVLAVAMLGLGGCIHHHHHRLEPVHSPVARRTGPPPHAPAHGYRRAHPRDGVELAYDAKLGVYVVLGHASLYWDGSRYLRWASGGWSMSARVDGGWVEVSYDAVPASLAAAHPHPPKKSKGAAKHGWKPGYGPPAKHGHWEK